MHAESDLSAYLDGELAPAERGRLAAHLAGCERCAGRLAELRATASLIGALPYSRAARSLVPSVTQRWRWLRPVRSFSMFASGAFLFVFLLTAVARTGAGLSGAGAPSAAQPAASAFGAGGAAEATSLRPAAPAAQAPTAAPTAVPAPAFGAVDSAQQRTTSASAAPTAFFDAQKRAEAASPTVAIPPQEGVLRVVAGAHEPDRNALLDPLVWLALAVLAAVLAVGAHLRLRRA